MIKLWTNRKRTGYNECSRKKAVGSVNDFNHMWDFGSMDGVDFPHSNRIHSLMQKRVQKLLEILEKDRNVQKIVIFGSALEFRCGSSSDLDVYIEKMDPDQAFLEEPVVLTILKLRHTTMEADLAENE